MSSPVHAGVLRGVCRNSARRCLFGAVDHEELQRDYTLLMKAEREDASRRWSFDFTTDMPRVGGDFKWVGLPEVQVPFLYRDCTVRADPRAKGAESESDLEKERWTPEQCDGNTHSAERHTLKRKQTNITGTQCVCTCVCYWHPQKLMSLFYYVNNSKLKASGFCFSQISIRPRGESSPPGSQDSDPRTHTHTLHLSWDCLKDSWTKHNFLNCILFYSDSHLYFKMFFVLLQVKVLTLHHLLCNSCSPGYTEWGTASATQITVHFNLKGECHDKIINSDLKNTQIVFNWR